MQKYLSKSILVVCMAIVLMGTMGFNTQVQARGYNQNRCVVNNFKDKDTQIDVISKVFNVNEQVLYDYYNKSWKICDLKTGAFLAYTANQSFDKVMTLRRDHSWSEVAGALNLSNYDIKTSYNDYIATYLAKELDFNKSVMTFLLEQNYTPQEIMHASLYSLYISSKSPADLIEAYNRQTEGWNRFMLNQGLNKKQIQEVNNKIKNINQDIFYNDLVFNCHPYCPCM